MVPGPRVTPEEFGEALSGLRAASGTSLESIAERTKISLRALAALEAGEFGKLPGRVFARLFLRQYLESVGATATEWVATFDAVWERQADASHPSLILPQAPVRRTRAGPWLIGLLLVAAAVAAVVFVAERPRGRVVPVRSATRARPLPTPAAPPTPVSTPVVAASAPTPPPGVLLVRTNGEPCWVEVRVAGQDPSSRLLPAGSTWTVDAAGKEVDLVLGDAGAATVEYQGDVRRPAGPSGAVARLHFDGSPAAASGR